MKNIHKQTSCDNVGKRAGSDQPPPQAAERHRGSHTDVDKSPLRCGHNAAKTPSIC